jgi:hypothetical protein
MAHLRRICIWEKPKAARDKLTSCLLKNISYLPAATELGGVGRSIGRTCFRLGMVGIKVINHPHQLHSSGPADYLSDAVSKFSGSECLQLRKVLLEQGGYHGLFREFT